MEWAGVTATVILVLSLWLMGGRLFSRVVIFPFQKGLRYDRGQFRGVIGPGRYTVLRSATHIQVVDVRRTLLPVPGQELLTQEGATAKVSLAAEFELTDPAAAVHAAADYRESLYSMLQIALRQVVAGLKLDQVLEGRAEIGQQVAELCREPAAALGITLHSVAVKDLMLPNDLKKAYADVIKAQKEGQAVLERARGETAALRSLANAARMMEEQPMLLQLRWLQAAQTSGSTVVAGPGAPAVPAAGNKEGK